MIRSVFCLRSMLSMVLQHWLTVADIRYLLILYRSSICYLMGKLFTHTHTCALVTARMIWYSVPQDGDAVWLGVELHCTEFIVSLSLGLWLSHVLFHAVWRIVLLWCFDSDCFPYHCPPVKKPYTFFCVNWSLYIRCKLWWEAGWYNQQISSWFMTVMCRSSAVYLTTSSCSRYITLH